MSSLGKYLNITIDVQLLPLLVSLRAVKVNRYLNSLSVTVLVGYLCSSQLTDGARCPIKLLKLIEPKQVPVSWPEACHIHPTTHGILRFKAGLFQDDSWLAITGLLYVLVSLPPRTFTLSSCGVHSHIRQSWWCYTHYCMCAGILSFNIRTAYQTLCLPLPQQDRSGTLSIPQLPVVLPWGTWTVKTNQTAHNVEAA